MKKVLFGMMAAAAMLFTSCSQEEFNFSTAEKANVAINLSTPQIASRAYSDGKSANHLQYAVYDVTDDTPVLITEFTKTNETIDLRKTVNFQLANGRTYNLVFWAASSNADGQYAVNFGTDKAEMTVNYGDFFKANCEDLDAFYACQQVKVNGSAVVDVKMYRPFAQINVGTDDYAAAAVAGSKPTMSSVTVDNVFSNLDLMTGAVTGEQSYTFTNNVIAAPYDEATGTGEKFPVDGYDYLAMAYALVDAEQALTTVTFTHTGGSVTEEITVGSVPVQRNYRTNLYGSILTSGIVANVEIVPAYEEPDNNIPVEGYTYDEATKTYTVYSADGLKKVYAKYPAAGQGMNGITVELVQDLDLGNATWAPINNGGATFNGNNHTISNFVVDQTKNGNASAGFFSSAIGTVKNINFENANIKGNFKVGVVAGDGLCAHIENVSVKKSVLVSTPWLAPGASVYDDGNNAGAIVGYLSAEHTASIKNCVVDDVEVTAFRKVGGLVGYLNGSSSSIPEVTGNKISNVKVVADMTEKNYDNYEKRQPEAGEIYGGKASVIEVDATNTATDVTVTVLTGTKASTNEEAAAAAKNGEDVYLTSSIEATASKENGYGGSREGGLTLNGGTLDGNGYTYSVKGTNGSDQFTSAINTTGGTIKNINIKGNNVAKAILAWNMTQDLYMDKIQILKGAGTYFAINIDGANNHNVYLTNSVIEGYMSMGASVNQMLIKDCTLGVGNYYGGSSIYDCMIKPYCNLTLENCKLDGAMYVDLSSFKNYPNATLIFRNCTVNGEKLTKANHAELLTGWKKENGLTDWEDYDKCADRVIFE